MQVCLQFLESFKVFKELEADFLSASEIELKTFFFFLIKLQVSDAIAVVELMCYTLWNLAALAHLLHKFYYRKITSDIS